MKPTPTLVRLHIDQGYLGRARSMIDALAARDPESVASLDRLWGLAAARARREAAIGTLRGLLSRVRQRPGRSGS